ncbi:MAG: diaminopimelate epimerase [Rhodospirillales bacterium]
MNDVPHKPPHKPQAAGGLKFVKMHGLGNDFVVLDGRLGPVALDRARARAIADRRLGVGCDQLFVLERPRDPKADVFMRIYNSDGGEVAACGNGARCVAALVMREKGSEEAVIETASGRLDAVSARGGRITVDMGPARLGWREIPLARECDTNHVPISAGPLRDAVCVNMGNPHAVFFVPDAAAVDLRALGPQLEHDEMFPERANIGVAEIVSSSRIRLRVWERGAGLTLACGTGACAALVAASRRSLVGRKASVALDGGELDVEWLADDRVTMTGPVSVSFTGTLDAALLG